MPKVTIIGPGLIKLCPHVGPHGRVHETWQSRDGPMGVCMMTDFHLDRAIRMLLKSMDAILKHYKQEDAPFIWEPDYNSCEDKIDMLNRERRRREMVRKGWRHEDGLIAGGATGVSASIIDHYINGDHR